MAIGDVRTITLDGPDIELGELSVTQLTQLYAALAAEIRRRGERLRKTDQKGHSNASDSNSDSGDVGNVRGDQRTG